MRANPENGFTLLEVMIAMTILAVGLTAVTTLFSRSAIAVSEVESFERANVEARSRLAQFLNAEIDPPAVNKGECTGLPGGMWSVESKRDPDNRNVSIVTVKVLFNAGGRQRIFSMKTAQADMALPLRVKDKQGNDL